MKKEHQGINWETLAAAFLPLQARGLYCGPEVGFIPYPRLSVFLRFKPLEQWFSTFSKWQPTKQNKTQLRDPFTTLILL